MSTQVVNQNPENSQPRAGGTKRWSQEKKIYIYIYI